MIQSKLPFHSPSTSTTSTSTSQTTITTKEPQIVLVLCGVVGTGKSTLAIAMEQLPGWVRINQDELKTRSVCETRVHKALREGKSVIIDRQNYDKPQRSTWIQIAKSYPNVSVRAFVLSTSEEECMKRLKLRRNHPTVESPAQALALLDRFCGLWVEPNLNEGFDRLIVLPALPNTEGLTVELLTSLLKVLNDSPPPSKNQRQPARRGY